MCGRFARYAPLSDWVEALGGDADPALFKELIDRDITARYNVAPGTKTWIVAYDSTGDLTLTEHKWTFPTSRGNRINVRSETAHRVPEYKEHYDKHRCAVLANGFYEPMGARTVKVRPWYFFQPKDGAPLFLGAISKQEGFSILTRTPVSPVSEVHDRSPVIVPADNVIAWLDPDLSGREALERLAPTAAGGVLASWPVSDAAKHVTNEGPELIERTG